MGAEDTEDTFNLDLYQREECLGKGSFGTVFKWKLKNRANASDLPLWIAVKEIVPPDVTQGAPVGREADIIQKREKDLQREHTFLKKYPHDNIVSYLGRIDDRHSHVTYFVMELCTTNLKLFRKGRLLAAPEVSIIMKHVLTALDYLHKNKIIHRDIKPGNILVKTDQADLDLKAVHISRLTFIICDFGLARYMYNNNNSTMTLSTVGTLKYVPPEARDDHKDKIPIGHYTASFDVFSAGVIAHELITGMLNEDVTIYTNFEKLQESLGHNCDEIILGFLQCMLHANKRDRKSPTELLFHPFIKLGQQFLNIEQEREETVKTLLDRNQEHTKQLRDSNEDNEILRREMSLQCDNFTRDMATLTDEIRQLKGKISVSKPPDAVNPSPAPKQQVQPLKKETLRKKKVTRAHTREQQQFRDELQQTIKVNDQLWKASLKGDVETMKSALRGGAQLEYKRDFGFIGPSTALHVAAKNGNLSATQLLLKEGANVDAATDGIKSTALMLASLNGNQDVVETLIRHGANVNLKRSDGWTSLHLAANNVYLSVCKLLVEDGKADINARDEGGKTPLAKVEKSDYGTKRDRDAVIKYLKGKGATA